MIIQYDFLSIHFGIDIKDWAKARLHGLVRITKGTTNKRKMLKFIIHNLCYFLKYHTYEIYCILSLRFSKAQVLCTVKCKQRSYSITNVWVFSVVSQICFLKFNSFEASYIMSIKYFIIIFLAFHFMTLLPILISMLAMVFTRLLQAFPSICMWMLSSLLYTLSL